MRAALFALLASFLPLVLEAGELQTRTLRSDALGRELSLNVLLPDGYQKEGVERYPVVYLLHGYGGDYREWERVGVAAEAAGLQAIIAMPEGLRRIPVPPMRSTTVLCGPARGSPRKQVHCP